MRVLKGHGTENDFVVVPDLDGALTLTPELVRALCDRHAGIGADGVLRVVRSAKDPDAERYADDAEFFMDYRNADGSIAEMCGNGVRVFMRYLQRVSLVGLDAAVATRGGVMRVRADIGGDISVEMGQPRILADRPVATVAQHPDAPPFTAAGTAVLMPNPHVVVPVASEAELAALDLARPPRVEPPLPEGQNVEFVVRRGPRHLVMRVHERGVGETRSCGTGICAVVAAAASADGCGADGEPWRVDVPGGTCTVTWKGDGRIELAGPAVLLAEIDVDDAWLAASAGAASASAAE
ncbi:MAG TPA: diaminopimelate epimerase [Jatrophihabitantaceae bacterium]|nr:diaminopimelate epimerase [Jatrophihabitantaceae bacterium]